MIPHSEDVTQLFKYLKCKSYQFVTITPRSHRQILQREQPPIIRETALREFFGWNRWVPIDLLEPELLKMIRTAGWTETSQNSELIQSKWRVSTLDELFFLHSSFPTTAEDSIFFGPDSYRYVHFLKSKVKHAHAIADIGSGSGVGGIALAKFLHLKADSDVRVAFSDVNPKALSVSSLNALANHVLNHEVVNSDVLAQLPKGYDTLISNPPFMIDAQKRAYRDGGADHGTGLSRKIVAEALDYLQDGGCLYLYTGSPVLEGQDLFKEWLFKNVSPHKWQLSYEEIDPDIFGEMLGNESYKNIERIAAVGVELRNVSSRKMWKF